MLIISFDLYLVKTNLVFSNLISKQIRKKQRRNAKAVETWFFACYNQFSGEFFLFGIPETTNHAIGFWIVPPEII